MPLFAKPFIGDFILANYFDHDLPFEYTDHNGYQLTWWGMKVWPGIDGHNAYDFRLPEGTPVLAAAAGSVIVAGTQPPANCPPLGHDTQGNTVTIEHQTNGPRGTVRVRTIYEHLSRIDVQPNQRVSQGAQIGLSGTTGCSTGPHLHFQTDLYANGKFIPIDPFGWDGPGTDPWAQNASGTQSLWLWQDGKVPGIAYRDVQRAPNPNPTDAAPVAITYLRAVTWHDDVYPNNQFVDLTLDLRFASSGSHDMTGHTLQNNAGDVFRFPDGLIIQQGQPVRVFMGPGQNTATQLYWGRTTGAFDPMGDCLHLLYPDGRNLYRTATPGGSCS